MLDSAAALMSKVSKNCAISRLHGSARKIVVKIQTVFVVRLERNHDKIIVVI